ncbi:MAG: NAD(P)H-hydrate dehydratase [Nitrospira sp. SB0666_bin_27]|nr:NAD(P)H-hydrate dehydratase [Nitrospira sp. SB0666_bin_27]
MKIVTSHQMRELDRRTIHEAGVPGKTLMERAGAGVVSAMGKTFDTLKGKTVTVFCGKGNNGGDGFVVARLLRQKGSAVQVCLLAQARDLKGDAKLMYQRFVKGAGRSKVLSSPSPDRVHRLVRDSHVLVDALLGTGTSSPVAGPYQEAIQAMNASEAPIVAVDLPSGIDADTGDTLGTAVQADLTVTFGNPKLGLFLGAGVDHAGRVHCVDIGIPSQYVEDLSVPIEMLTPTLIRPWLPERPASSHKGTFGHAGIIAGSSGKSGAAALAAKAALRAGAGLVTVATPSSVQASVASGIPEVMTLPLPETADHTLSRDALPLLQTFLPSRSSIGIGPGLSTQPETADVVRTLIDHCDRPLVIDADALNALAGHTRLLRARPLSPLLTPHPGEMARLLGESSAATVNRNRLGIAHDFARTHSSVVVLKGARTIVALPDGATAISPTGNPGMATAGTGDVLTGILTGLLAQGVSPWEAAQSGAFLHGLAGDLAAQAYGYPSLMAGDLLACLPQAITQVLHAVAPRP